MGGPRITDTGAAADRHAYADPDPVKVAQLIASHGWDAATGRWFWLHGSAIGHHASLGRQRMRHSAGTAATGPRNRRRSVLFEPEEAVVADVYALGGVKAAAERHGLLSTFVITLLRERCLDDYLRMSPQERGLRVLATRAARENISPRISGVTL